MAASRKARTVGEPTHGVNDLEFTKIVFDIARRMALVPRAMKKILSLLMCYVFLQAETFALRGGPGGGGGQKVSGTYSGVMIESSGTTDVALFLLNAQAGGASNGQIVIFSQSGVSSDAYNCNLTGLSDTSRGGSGQFIGVFTGAAVVTTATSIQSVSGQMTVKISANSNSQSPRLSGTASSRTMTVTGTAGSGTGGTGGSPTPTTVVGPLRQYVVDGWQTSATNNTGLSL